MTGGAHREAWRLAWPLILSNLSLPLRGIVETAVVGHLPEPHHLGAVAVGTLLFNVLFFAFGFLRMGTTGLTAQAFGAADGGEVRAVLARALLLALAAALLLLLAADVTLAAARAAFAPSPAVMAGLDSYVRIRLLGAPAALAQMVLLGWLLGLQNARGPLLLLVVTNGLNAALDLWFVLGLGWGVPGVARAAVCAEYAGLALGLWLARRELARVRLVGGDGGWSWPAVVDAAALRRLLAVNRDILLRSLCIESAYLTFTALGSRQGEVVLAANAILLNFQLFAAYGLDGFAHAAEAMVGRRLGARDRAGFRAAARANVHWGLALAALLTLAFALAGPLAVDLMTGLPEVRAAAHLYLPYMVVTPLIAVWAFLFDGVFIGATRTREMRDGMAVALAVFLAVAFALRPALGNHGLWLALMAFLAARGLWLGAAYARIERRGGFVAAA